MNASWEDGETVDEFFKLVFGTNHFLVSEQADICPQMSTVHQLTRLTQTMEEAFNKNENTLAVIIDFKNAYDWVWRKKFFKGFKRG